MLTQPLLQAIEYFPLPLEWGESKTHQGASLHVPCMQPEWLQGKYKRQFTSFRSCGSVAPFGSVSIEEEFVINATAAPRFPVHYSERPSGL